MAGVFEKILGGALFDDPSSKHHRYIFCHVPDDTQIVADEEVCQLMAFPQIQHQVQHLRLNRNIKSGNRFIRHNHGRTGDQGSRKGNPLTLSPGKFMGVFGGVRSFKANFFQRFPNQCGCFFGRLIFLQAQRFCNRTADGMPWIKRTIRILEDHLHPSTQRFEFFRRDCIKIFTLKKNPAVLRRLKSHDGPCQGGLAATRFPDNPETFSLSQSEGNSVQCPHLRAG